MYGMCFVYRRHFGRLLALALWVSSCVTGALAQADIQIVGRTIDREGISGTLLEFSLEGGLRLIPHPGSEPVTVPLSDIVQINNVSPVTSAVAPLCVLLVGGDKLFGQITGTGPDQIILDSVMGGGIAIPLQRIRACLTPKADLPPWRSAAARLMRTTHSEDDRVLLSNHDVLSGLVAGIGPDAVVFEHRQREITIDLDLIVVLALASEPAVEERPPQARIEFVDGSALTVSRIRWSPQALDLTFFDGTLQGLAAETVRSVEIRGGRWTWLSALPVQAYEHTPLMSLKWSYQLDRNVAGGVLSIGGRKFQRGIGVHSRAKLTFRLDGKYRVFTSLCGLDDSAGKLADVTAEVVVDGEVKWKRDGIEAGEPPIRVRIDLHGARMLELTVDCGKNGDLQDRFDWADAALIR